MTKTELMENYTMEQLADMVVKSQNLLDILKYSDTFLKTGLFENPAVAACESKTEILQRENQELKSQLHRKETEINQIDDILEKLFGVTHDIVSKPDEFEKILTEKAEGYKTISDFLPEEPIEVASMLINAEGEYEHIPVMKMICGTDKGTYKLFGISGLRQIAEHLLIYCNGNESEGEE